MNWRPGTEPPPAEGRYLIQYRYRKLGPRYFIGDWLPGTGWSSGVAGIEVLWWAAIPEAPK